MQQPREGETVGEYIVRLEKRVQELEPPDGFTIQEWHIGQVYCYLLWRDGDGADYFQKWSDRLASFEERFPEATRKFARYMGWGQDGKRAQRSPSAVSEGVDPQNEKTPATVPPLSEG